MAKSKIHFYLTKTQRKELEPLFDEARVACNKNEAGMVILQAWESGVVDAGFVPYKQATRITKILKRVP